MSKAPQILDLEQLTEVFLETSRSFLFQLSQRCVSAANEDTRPLTHSAAFGIGYCGNILPSFNLPSLLNFHTHRALMYSFHLFVSGGKWNRFSRFHSHLCHATSPLALVLHPFL